MIKKKSRAQRQKNKALQIWERKTPVIAYRLQCEKAGNGLSHYVMYGDAKNSLV